MDCGGELELGYIGGGDEASRFIEIGLLLLGEVLVLLIVLLLLLLLIDVSTGIVIGCLRFNFG